MSVLFYIFVMTNPSPAPQTNTCLVDKGAEEWTKPEFEVEHPLLDSVPSYRRYCTSYETVKLKSGEEISIKKSGCAHVNRTISITQIESKAELSNSKYYLTRILKYLALPLKRGRKVFGSNVLKGVKMLLDSNSKLSCTQNVCKTSVPCGDATCELELRRSSKEYVQARLYYDFAL